MPRSKHNRLRTQRKRFNHYQFVHKTNKEITKNTALIETVQDFFKKITFLVTGIKRLFHFKPLKDMPRFNWVYIGRMKPLNEGMYSRTEIKIRMINQGI